MERETSALGNGSTLMFFVYEHNVPKMPELTIPSFTLGEWEATCSKAERDGISYKYARVGPLVEETKLQDIQDGFRLLDGGE